jgi:hypothetical protein
MILKVRCLNSDQSVWEKSPGRVPVGAEVDVGDGSR